MAKKIKRYRPVVISKFEELPMQIQSMAGRLLHKSLGEAVKKADFSMALVYDIEKYLSSMKEYYDSLPENAQYNLTGYVVPKYSLSYLYCLDEGKRDYYTFHIEFDEYGQVLKYELPEDYYSTIIPLYGKEKAIVIAMDYASEKEYANAKMESSRLYYENGELLWDIWLLQNKEKGRGGIKHCKAITVNVASQSITKDNDAQISKSGYSQLTMTQVFLDENDIPDFLKTDK